MKKVSMVLLFALVTITIVSCSNNDSLISEMKNEFEKHELPNFNDPKSFEEVEAKIVDTIFEKQDEIEAWTFRKENPVYKSSMEMYKKFYDDEKNVSYLKDMAEENYKSYLIDKEKYENEMREVDSAFNVIKTIPDDKIRRIILSYKIRAKNYMGGTILKEVNVNYYPEPYETKDKIKRHFRFDINGGI